MASKLRSFLLALLALSAGGSYAQAPDISYSSPQTYHVFTEIPPLIPTSSGVAPSGYNNPVAIATGIGSVIAVDASGDIYTADNSTIRKLPAGSSTPVIITSGLTGLNGLAVDNSGNLYVAGNHAVMEIKAGSAAVDTLVSGYGEIAGLAVDQTGNLYYSDAQANTVYELPAGNNIPVRLGAGFNVPFGVAVDGAGNVYVADRDNNAIKKIPAGNGTPVIIASSFTLPSGVAVDVAGNVYVADNGNNAIKEIPAGGGGVITLYANADSPFQVAVDGTGNIYESDLFSHSINIIKPVGGYFINKPLSAGLSFDSNTGIISGKPTAASAATDYTITAYNNAGGSTANLRILVDSLPLSISYNSPQTYNVAITIPPLIPTSTDVPAFGYSNPATVGHGLSALIAVDIAGNVYECDYLNNAIKKLPFGVSTLVTVATGVTAPEGVAVDAAGNLYVAGNHAVVKIPAGGGTPVTLTSGLTRPMGISVDAAGNVYVADFDGNAVYEIPTGGGAAVAIGSGFNEPFGLAVDAIGNVYVADAGNIAVKKIPAGNGTPVIIGTGFKAPRGVVVDPVGNVFVADYYPGNAIKEIPVGGGSTIMVASEPHNPTGVGIDGAGNIYEMDNGDGLIKTIKQVGGYSIDKTLPPGLNFDQNSGIISGTPTLLSPATDYTVTAHNQESRAAATVNITVGGVANLSNLSISAGTLTPVFSPDNTAYTVAEPNAITSVTITPTTGVSTNTITVNGTLVTSGAGSTAIPLNVGPNTITTVVTGSDGSTKSYTVTATRTGVSNTGLSDLTISAGEIRPSFDDNRVAYKAYVNNEVPTVTLTPTTIDPTSSVTINGTAVASGTASPDISLLIGKNPVSVLVRNQAGDITFSYSVIISRNPSANAKIAHLSLSAGKLDPRFYPDTFAYTVPVKSSVSVINVTPVLRQDKATVTVNGVAVASGTPSQNIPLSTGSNTISLVTLAQNGTTTFTYTITVIRGSAGLNALYRPVGVEKPHDMPGPIGEGITVHQGISPNGDGQNDYLVIDGITNYPDNKLTIMNRSGQLVFEAKGYDNSTRLFDGHSNKTGAKQLPGTYFYSLDYTVKGVAKHKTGFIVLKY